MGKKNRIICIGRIKHPQVLDQIINRNAIAFMILQQVQVNGFLQ